MHWLCKLAVRTGLEPATPCVTGTYSNQLNYRTVVKFQNSGTESESPDLNPRLSRSQAGYSNQLNYRTVVKFQNSGTESESSDLNPRLSRSQAGYSNQLNYRTFREGTRNALFQAGCKCKTSPSIMQ